jgi:aspartate racemase
VAFLAGEVKRLADAGAEVALFASNMPHLFFREIETLAPIRLISIVDAARAAAKARGLRRVGLLGTRFTMESGIYHQVFAEASIAVVIPEPADIERIHVKYMSELVVGRFEEPTRQMFRDAIDRLKSAEGIDGVILGGTEIPLLLPDATYNGLPMLDTTQTHVNRALDVVLGTG